MKLRNLFLCGLVCAAMLSLTACKKEKSSVGNVEDITFAQGDKIAEIVIEDYGTIRAKLFPDLAPNAVANFEQLAGQGYYDGLKIHRVIADNMIQGGSLNGDGTGGTAVINETGYFTVETSELARNFYGALGYANINGRNTTQFYIVNNKTPVDISKYNVDLLKERVTELTEQQASLDAESSQYTVISAEISHYTKFSEMLEKSTEQVAAKYASTGGIPHWDGGYTVFGQVFEGFDVLDAVSAAEVTTNAENELSKPLKDIVISSVRVVEYVPAETAEAGDGKKKTASDSSTPEENTVSEGGTAEAKPDEAGSEGTVEVTSTIEAGEPAQSA